MNPLAKYISLSLSCVGLLVASSAFGQVSRTPWQMHEGQGVIKLDTELPSNGALPENNYIAFNYAEIPAEGQGWGPAPNPDTIGFGGANASKIGAAGGACRRAVDYTYFQTFVEVPADGRVDEFKITFNGMDDASRITIFNGEYPQGRIVAGSYVTRTAPDTEAATTDLKDLVATGRNRIVITQVDWCPVGNQLASAQVLLNGGSINATVTTVLGPFIPVSHGDVHIRSTDGLHYDFQAAGDYLYIQSTDGEVVVQARQEMWDKNPKVSVNRAGAMKVMGDRVEWFMLPSRALYVNGKLTGQPTSRLALPAGGAIEVTGNSAKQVMMVYWPQESFTGRMTAYVNNTMDIEVRKVVSSPRTYEGLIGNMDGRRDNDLQVRGGDYLDPVLSNENIVRVGESWRLRADENLFTLPHPAPAGASAQNQPGIADLDPTARREADQVCKVAGVSDAMALHHCIYDVAATGDKTFVESAKQFQETVALLAPNDRAGEVVEPAHVLLPPVAPASSGAGLFLPGEKLHRGSRYSMSGHYVTFQDDGNLCMYASVGDRWVWCINNDPSVQYQRATATEMTRDGRLMVTDAAGGVIWQAPTDTTQPGTQAHITSNGALELRAPSGAVVWASR